MTASRVPPPGTVEQAARLLDVASGAELDTVLGGVVSGAARAAGGALPAATRRALVAVLRRTAERTLPTLVTALGDIPAADRPAATAARVFGLELEGMSSDDRDLEIACQIIRLAREAAVRAAFAGPVSPAAAVRAAVMGAGRDLAPGLVREERHMFGTGMQTAQYGQGQYEGPPWRRPRRCAQWESQGGPYDQGEFEQGPYQQGPYEQGAYGQGGYEQEGEDGAGEYDQGEEQFLPLIPIVGQVLGGLLGGLGRREAEYESGGEYPQGEAGEAEEQFLRQIFLRVLGQEAEVDEAMLSPAQMDGLTGQLMEAADEQELGRILGGIVNTVGRAVQGIRGAASSPQGRALLDAIIPIARAALPHIGGAVGGAIAPGAGAGIGRSLGTAAGTLFETESGETDPEQADFEVAQNIVRLTAAAAHDVATAPPGGSPRLVGEFGIFRAARIFARPLFSRALRAISPLARRVFGGRYGFPPYGRPPRWGYPGRGYPGWGYPGRGYPRWGYPGRYGRYFPRYAYRYAPPVEPGPGEPPEPPEPPPPPPQPGYRWVAVPIGAPDPVEALPPPPPAPAAAGPAPELGEQEEYGYGYSGHGMHGDRSGWDGDRRTGRWVHMGA